MSFFIADAYANAAPAAQEPSAFANIAMLVVFMLVFYFLLWRPQAKRQKEHQSLMAGLQKGDEIVFAGGLLGKVKAVDEDYAVVEINDNLTVKIQKASVLATLPEGTLKSVGTGANVNLTK
ncbi:preprotein translocase subunit YajC [Agitococcus lubricus]|uniref:Sec translocon accessory complex subunit YajC n=1 Tax=Agitococcus lubricus TaxID=1077255 RepID=A0A2T5J0Z6_9GAMM|nr:preprotein translocase subunit YajC [Agitococcus lubricus]PTQ90068.1 preprotein translocase subunit YajC [Agitococcus lubricus]